MEGAKRWEEERTTLDNRQKGENMKELQRRRVEEEKPAQHTCSGGFPAWSVSSPFHHIDINSPYYTHRNALAPVPTTERTRCHTEGKLEEAKKNAYEQQREKIESRIENKVRDEERTLGLARLPYRSQPPPKKPTVRLVKDIWGVTWLIIAKSTMWLQKRGAQLSRLLFGPSRHLLCFGQDQG